LENKLNNIILDKIPFKPDINLALKRLHIKEDSEDASDFMALLAEAQAIANPKVLYGMATIDDKQDNQVTIEGVTLTSRVLRVNLEKTEHVFPFVGTCGMELEDWANSFDDVFIGYWAETIKEFALMEALTRFESDLKEMYQPGHVSTMSPGSLEDWPISEQVSLFNILRNTREKIGVQLTDSYLMVPTKSVSGIRFPLDGSFESCQLCPRVNCPNRRAPYDETLYEKKFCPSLA
jgi:hypothetical protein